MDSAPRPRPWLPDLCRLPALLTIMVAAESAILVLALTPSAEDWNIPRFAGASLFAQWLALASGLLLCRGAPALQRLPIVLGAVLAWLLPVAVAALGGLILHIVDSELGLGLTLPRGQRSEFIFGCAAVTAVVGAATLHYFYVQQQWAMQVQAKAEAEMRALQARIRPHFLFNSINSIASLVRRDPPTAERALEDLADLFRAALGAGQGDATLDEELTLIERYLSVEKLRLGDRLQLDWRLADDLPRSFRLPRLVLQPLVENAVIHGVARLEAGGVICIEAFREAGSLCIRVGNPTPPQATAKGHAHAQQSIEQRLRHRFGDEVRMAFRRRADYYECELRLPLSAPSAPDSIPSSRVPSP
ncbi:MAG: histidine kinase [Xanthomonadales bacterium]|nr:histidine kinase [Xanthomonadales bacterium]